jgi:hypothetical protein
MVTLDTDAESQIDSGYDKTATMAIAGEILSFSAQQSSFINGEVNTFTFSIQASIPVFKGDQLSFVLPDEVGAPANVDEMQCKGTSNVIDLTCSVVDKTITIIFNDFENDEGAFTWEISGIKNPTSTKTS